MVCTTFLIRTGRAQAGMLAMDEKFGDLPPYWMVYFRVADMAVSAEKVDRLGGKFMVGPF